MVIMMCLIKAEGANKQPEERPISYTERIPGTLVKFEMVGVPGGEILMPDPAKKGATKRIKIKPFWIGKTEVTWDEYDVFVFKLDVPEGTSENKDAVSRPSKPYGTVDRGFGHKGYPAINVSYFGAEQYCKWLSAKTGRKYRLPTEAEWEYACRAGMPPPEKDKLAEFAWFWQEKTQPVGKKSPNAWGIYDMLGNVAEWCTDLSGKPVLCGGAFDDMAKTISPTARKYQDESWQANDPQSPKSKWWLSDAPFAGFRVIRVK
ncbi:MAG: formylglycine-generating enzyme family protein [Armatimonadetes bacterium]|nr:formylglycine-generating enzyme family protein [Armatimonadota bacterium]